MLSAGLLKRELKLTKVSDMGKNYFSEEELACQHCGKYGTPPDFLELLNEIRRTYNRPMVISSGYRCPDHPIEAAKDKPGSHASGRAVDVLVAGEDALDLIVAAKLNGICRIGVKQKGDWNSRFIHLDDDSSLPNALWSY